MGQFIEKFNRTYRKENLHRSTDSRKNQSWPAVRWPSVATKSTAAGISRLPELEQDPRRHISEEWNQESI